MSFDSDVVWPRHAGAVSRILIKRDRFIDSVLSPYIGYTPRGDVYSKLVDNTAAFFKAKNRRVVRESLVHLAGSCIAEDEARLLAWRLAANAHRLRRGELVTPWTAQTSNEHAQIQFVDCELVPTRTRKPMVSCRFVFLSGTPAGMTSCKLYSQSFCRVLGRRMGYTTARHGRPMQHYSELTGLRLSVLLTPDDSSSGRPGFTHVKCAGSALEWNKQIIGLRFRSYRNARFECPKGYTHACFRCDAITSECPAACRGRRELDNAVAVSKTDSEGRQ